MQKQQSLHVLRIIITSCRLSFSSIVERVNHICAGLFRVMKILEVGIGGQTFKITGASVIGAIIHAVWIVDYYFQPM